MASVGAKFSRRHFLLTVYTRHYPFCPQTVQHHRRCHCPIWIMGTIESTGAFVRVSARTRAWEQAEKGATDGRKCRRSIAGASDRKSRSGRIYRQKTRATSSKGMLCYGWISVFESDARTRVPAVPTRSRLSRTRQQAP